MGARKVVQKLRAYWTLTKSLQTGLLLVTGLAGFSSGRCPVLTWQVLLGLTGSLFLTIGGSTVLNMVYDRDIDGIMRRTWRRPLPVGSVGVREALTLGAAMTALGLVWAVFLSPLYAIVVLAGVAFDLAVYTLWLKRRSPYAIIVGGLAGAMPVLAGRVLATGRVDAIGLLLGMSVLFWIPTHIMTFSIRYADDYARAGVPTFPATYGVPVTRLLISLSSVGAALSIIAACVLIGISWGYLGFLALLGAALLTLAVANVLRPSPRLNVGLFKFASVYMLCSMLLVVAAG